MVNRIFIIILLTLALRADEVRPLYLELKEQSINQYLVTLKIPAKGDKRLKIDVKLPTECITKSSINSNFIKGAYIQRWIVQCGGGLGNREILINGLKNTNTDLLLRVDMLDGSSFSNLLTSIKTSYHIPPKASKIEVISTYTWLGITHILLGYDHLSFVLALLLIVGNMRKLLLTITAFTLAHSITMAGATLGILYIPQKPVEAVIALSIIFLAIEIISQKKGIEGIASKYPWVVAFIFGLLHGFGFAGALSEIGLPQNAITIALLFFNVGVEIGQLIFITSIVLIYYLIQKFDNQVLLDRVEMITVYSIGAISSFWLIGRVSGF